MLRTITIEPVLNGFVVQVGCQTVVFDDLELMLGELRDYYNDPDKTERDYMRNGINSGKLGALPMVSNRVSVREEIGPPDFNEA